MTQTKVELIDLNGKELVLDADADTSITADTDDVVHVKTGGTDRLTIQSTAGNNVVIADGLTLTNGDIAVASGHGINFAATSDATGKASELLDDYEEGTFTVSLTGGAGGTAYTMASGHSTGHYTKIGNRVYINMYIRSSSINSAGGSTAVNGLPFTSSSASLSYGTVVSTYANNLNLGAAGYNVAGYVATGSTIAHLVTFDHAGGVSGLTSAEWSDNGESMLFITYAV